MEPLGDFALKGLQQKMPVYAVISATGAPSNLAAADAAPATRTGSGTYAGSNPITR
jgi:hypothetical protein